MNYQVLLVDDEPFVIKQLQFLIEQNAPGFSVAATAGNGIRALEILDKEEIDLVLTDVLMPGMDGIRLSEEIQAKYSDILSVVISGFNDFKYVKGALKSGVSDYLLKPLRPSDIGILMKEMKEKLDKKYYEKRCRILRNIVAGKEISEEQLLKYFDQKLYYCAVYRKNGLPGKYSLQSLQDTYSMLEEKVIRYGRDDMETLMICPAALVNDENVFYNYFLKTVYADKKESSFVTGVIKNEIISTEFLGKTIYNMIRFLDNHIQFGKNQILTYDDNAICKIKTDKISTVEFETAVMSKNTTVIKKELKNLMKRWDNENRSAIWIETQILYLFTFLQKQNILESFDRDLIEVLFTEAESVAELADALAENLQSDRSDSEEQRDKKIYTQIKQYCIWHLKEDLSVSNICCRFAISQTSLNRMFQKYDKQSYKRALTECRMKKAKEMMDANPNIMVYKIAENVGYEDQFYFSRVFKSFYGYGPSEYMDYVLKTQNTLNSKKSGSYAEVVIRG